jgi:hypothetical protein
MFGSQYYREEARRCRKLAAGALNLESARRWFELADEYDQLAVSLERRGSPPPVQSVRMQQPVQEQQRKSDDKKS